jgi:hypothetical protein
MVWLTRRFSDKANFINFCSGQTLTNGLQNKAGSCNGVGMYHRGEGEPPPVKR